MTQHKGLDQISQMTNKLKKAFFSSGLYLHTILFSSNEKQKHLPLSICSESGPELALGEHTPGWRKNGCEHRINMK